MSEPSPNRQQRKLIERTDGTYLVDAGAGTGKTFTITRRYANILDQPGVEPADVLLVTFTRNAAGEMRDRIVEESSYDLSQLQDAPINTFHGYCYRLLRRYGHETPSALGIDDVVPRSLELVEDQVREAELFGTFASQFEDRHPEYADLVATVGDLTDLRSLVGQLAAKGVVPAADGWFRGSDEDLFGDREAFFDAFETANRSPDGNSSDARSGVTGNLDSDMAPYVPDAPAYDDVDQYPQVNPALVEAAFDESRGELAAFVHDVYYEYLAFMLSRNVLTQGLMLALAFVMLCEDATARAAVRHEYVMVDEFQDTNELQFKIALLLANTNNVCVVGDWKQSIFGFQYTSVENITRFEQRLDRYYEELTADADRLPYEVGDVEDIPLRQNYRSTQEILTFSEESLTVPATSREEVDAEAVTDEITSLETTRHVENSRIEAVTHEDELDLVLDRVQEIVGNPEYAVEKHDEPQAPEDASAERQRAAERERLAPPTYEDIAVFTRKRSFARDLLERAEASEFPLAYEGGVELYDTDQAKLLLAWLRIVESDDDRGWALVLEEAGYTLPQARDRLEDGAYPAEMVSFRETLRAAETLGGLARRVFDRYGFTGAYADGLLEELTGLYDGTVYSRAEAVELIEEKLEAGATPEIDANPGENAVTLQTIHGAKGLEYPIVILANLNQGQFPHTGFPSSSVVRYDDTVGLRQTRTYDESTGQPHVFDSWQYDVLSGAVPSTYDEERRLLYVAMTRAKRHLLFTAGEDPSNFFSELPVEPTTVEPSVDPVALDPDAEEPLSVSIPEHSGPVRAGVHDIMDDTVFEAVTDGRGTEFGSRLHDYLEAHVIGNEPALAAWTETDAERAEFTAVRKFVDTLDGELSPEQTVVCPLDGSPRVVLTGIIDLLHVGPDRVDIVDYKTDLQRHAHEEYRKQLSVYYHVLSATYPDRDIRCLVYYTADDERVAVDPIPMAEIRRAAEEHLL